MPPFPTKHQTDDAVGKLTSQKAVSVAQRHAGVRRYLSETALAALSAAQVI